MEKFFEKLKALDIKKVKAIQIIAGILVGAIIWASIFVSSETEDSILKYLFVIVFIVFLIIQRYFERQTGWKFNLYRLVLIITIGVGIVVFLVYGISTGRLFAGA